MLNWKILTPILISGILFGQAHSQSAGEIIREIDSQPVEEHIMVCCGTGLEEAAVQHERVRRLVALGPIALPQITEALAAILADGPTSPKHPRSLYWLALADATIEGPKAYPVLRRMLDDPRFELFRYSLTNAISVALHLTTYVDRAVEPPYGYSCSGPEPRDALASLIFAFETGDRELFNKSLGSVAAFPASRVGAWWPDARMLNRDLTKTLAMGFRFKVRGTWSSPEDSLEQRSGPNSGSDPVAVIETHFSDKTGRDCGEMQIEFLQIVRTQDEPEKYVVNDANIVDLFKIIASCTSAPN